MRKSVVSGEQIAKRDLLRIAFNKEGKSPLTRQVRHMAVVLILPYQMKKHSSLRRDMSLIVLSVQKSQTNFMTN